MDIYEDEIIGQSILDSSATEDGGETPQEPDTTPPVDDGGETDTESPPDDGDGEQENPVVPILLVVEDGLCPEGANSYVTVEYADKYNNERGRTEWAELDEENKKRYLIRATEYIDNVFRWYGRKQVPEQALRFPRTGLVDYEGAEITGIPDALKQAVCDAALIAAAGTELFQTADENGDVVSERIGELSFTYSKKNQETVKSSTPYDSINTKLRGLFKDTGKNGIIVGKVARA